MLRIPVRALRRRGPVWRFAGEAYVGETLCAEAEYSAMIADAPQANDEIHPTAIVEDGARLGADVEIGRIVWSVRMSCWAMASVCNPMS